LTLIQSKNHKLARLSNSSKLDSPNKISKQSLTQFSSPTKLDSVSIFQSEHHLQKLFNIAKQKMFSTLIQLKSNGKDTTLMKISTFHRGPTMHSDRIYLEMLENLIWKLQPFHAVGPIQEWSVGLSSKLSSIWLNTLVTNTNSRHLKHNGLYWWKI